MVGIVLSLEIQLEKNSFSPGEKVKGVLVINVSKPIRARKVQITFEGKEFTSLARGYGRYRHVFNDEYIIVVNTIDIWKAQEKNIFGPCNEQFPFEFQIPEQALSSVYSSGKTYNGISYEIKAKIDRPHAFDPNASCYIHVLPRAYEPFQTKPITRSFEDIEDQMELMVRIDKEVYIPGENVTGRVILKKEPSLMVQSVEITMVCVGSFTAQVVSDFVRDVVDVIHWEVDPTKGLYQWPFSLKTPEGERYSINGQLIKRIWEVEVQVKLNRKKPKSIAIPLLFVPLKTPAKPQN